MGAKKVLIVEDEEDILKLLEINLRKHEYEVTGVMTGEKALEAVKNEIFDLVLLDLMLPGIDGIEVCKALKSNPLTKELPVIMLTAKGEEGDIIKGFECGADDYVTKPFSLKVLMARVKTALRRTENTAYNKDSVVSIHNLYINPQKHEVLLGGKHLRLTSAEFKVLHLLASKPGWVLTRYSIIDEIRGEDYEVTDRSVDVLMVGLRKKMDEYGYYIETVRGVGYKFRLESAETK